MSNIPKNGKQKKYDSNYQTCGTRDPQAVTAHERSRIFVNGSKVVYIINLFLGKYQGKGPVD